MNIRLTTLRRVIREEIARLVESNLEFRRSGVGETEVFRDGQLLATMHAVTPSGGNRDADVQVTVHGRRVPWEGPIIFSSREEAVSFLQSPDLVNAPVPDNAIPEKTWQTARNRRR